MSTPTAQPARRRLAAIVAAAAAALMAGASPAAAQAAGARAVSGGAWGTAREVTGLAALNQGGFANITSVSCASPGTCSAGGSYTDSSGGGQAFVVSEVNGSWGKAKEVPGLAALNQGGSALITSVSCARAGTCAAGGSYTDSSGGQQAFVVSEAGGRWGIAQQVPGTAALNQAGSAGTTSVSCTPAGTCTAAGGYTDGSGSGQAFVVSEVGGTWGTAQQIPGTAALNQGGNADPVSVSCARAGSCAVGGFYKDGSGHYQAFVASKTNGTWGAAEQVPGTAALNQGGHAFTNAVSCAAAGTCSAGGFYFDGSGHRQAFVVTEVNGTWGTAQEVPGTAALNQGGNAETLSVSCAGAGTCAAGGIYTDSSGHHQAFVVTKA